MAGRAPAVARATLKAISTDQLGTAKHSLFGVLGQLQNSGVGQKVSRSIWTKWGDSCYWTVQRVEMTVSIRAHVNCQSSRLLACCPSAFGFFRLRCCCSPPTCCATRHFLD